MSDLCHNCGDCHLGAAATPCSAPLSHCCVCGNRGHQYNFCPISVRRVEPNYEYWMLCHNCDVWHLPRPCSQDLVKCKHCNCLGHLPTFCPLQPEKRNLGDLSNKRKRLLDSNDGAYDGLASDINQIDPKLLRNIQLQGAQMAMNFLGTQQDTKNYVYRTIAYATQTQAQTPRMGPPAGAFSGSMQPYYTSSAGNVVSLGYHPAPNINSGRSEASGYNNPYGDGNPYGRKDSVQQANMMTPVPSSAVKPLTSLLFSRGEYNGRDYEAMHDSFARGELANTVATTVEGSGPPAAVGQQDNGVQCDIDPGDVDQSHATNEAPRDLEMADHKETQASPANDTPNASSPADGTPSTPAPAKRRAAQRPRCADCKKRHAKCTHPINGAGKVSADPNAHFNTGIPADAGVPASVSVPVSTTVVAGADEEAVEDEEQKDEQPRDEKPSDKTLIVRLRIASKKFLEDIDRRPQGINTHEAGAGILLSHQQQSAIQHRQAYIQQQVFNRQHALDQQRAYNQQSTFNPRPSFNQQSTFNSQSPGSQQLAMLSQQGFYQQPLVNMRQLVNQPQNYDPQQSVGYGSYSSQPTVQRQNPAQRNWLTDNAARVRGSPPPAQSQAQAPAQGAIYHFPLSAGAPPTLSGYNSMNGNNTMASASGQYGTPQYSSGQFGGSQYSSGQFGGAQYFKAAAERQGEMSLAAMLRTENQRSGHGTPVEAQAAQHNGDVGDDATMADQQYEDEPKTDEERDMAILDALDRQPGEQLREEEQNEAEEAGAQKADE